jgi:uncharacterized protein YqcC (DUF446 family)
VARRGYRIDGPRRAVFTAPHPEEVKELPDGRLFTWVYTPRAHADGSVDQIVEEALAFPHEQSIEAFQEVADEFNARLDDFWREAEAAD